MYNFFDKFHSSLQGTPVNDYASSSNTDSSESHRAPRPSSMDMPSPSSMRALQPSSTDVPHPEETQWRERWFHAFDTECFVKARATEHDLDQVVSLCARYERLLSHTLPGKRYLGREPRRGQAHEGRSRNGSTRSRGASILLEVERPFRHHARAARPPLELPRGARSFGGRRRPSASPCGMAASRCDRGHRRRHRPRGEITLGASRRTTSPIACTIYWLTKVCATRS